MHKVTKPKYNSTLRRKNFIAVVKNVNIEIRSYIEYIKVDETCIASREFSLYIRYFENTRRSCNLVVF